MQFGNHDVKLFPSFITLSQSAIITTAAIFFFVTPAMAIPSPELVIGSISSVSQLVALVSAMLGGGAAAAGFRKGLNNGNENKGRKTALRFAAALFLIATLSIGFNIYQYTTRSHENLARLQATLIRPAQTPGTKILDPNLKETSLANQSSHSLGISTAQAEKLLDEVFAKKNSDILFIDVRETGENEMGTLPGSRHIRFPDLADAGIDFTGKKAILFCHNGNRSSETCEKLAKIGIDCRFITGGIEKWIVEGRKFSDATVRNLQDLRAIPPYSGRNILLNTDQAHDLIDTKGAQFVDVRYPGEFKLGHLPGAVNIPLRATPTAQLRTMISNLPKKPIIAACYDRRGCFISQVLGLELARAGYTFGGRYTLPWEFFTAPKPKPHIAAWLAASQKGLWQKAISHLAQFISMIANATDYLFAIILLAAFSRILVLPISLKAERDQIVTNKTKDELSTLKARLKDDPKRLARAMREFYRIHGLTPLRNMLALAFLPLMALGLSAVQMAASNNPVALLWFDDISQPGPYYSLPVLFAALASIYVHAAVAKTAKQKLFGWALGFPVFAALALMLGAAGGLYLVTSMLLLLLQRAYVTGNLSVFSQVWKSIFSSIDRHRYRRGIIPLSKTGLLEGCGNKSYRLSCLMGENISVPDGVVLNSRFLHKFLNSSALERTRLLDSIWRAVDAPAVAVRSSASAEDGEFQSFAGVFESHLDVHRDTLEEAILAVAASFNTHRAASYGSNDNNPGDGNILVQTMVDADYAGVLFTRDPQAPGLMMAEVVEGTADALVSAMATPRLSRYGRYSRQLIGKEAPPVDLAPLLELGMRAEALFATPQDIEWTYRNGRFQIVQSRDITTLNSFDDTERLRHEEWINALLRADGAATGDVMLEKTEMSEVLPRPTPLSLQLMQSLWASGGSVDHACRRLGLSYDVGETTLPHLITLFGRLYTDRRIAKRNAVSVSRSCAAAMVKNSERIASEFRDQFLPQFNEEMTLLESANFDKLPVDELLKLVLKHWQAFITETHVEVEIINIAASFHITKATAELEEAGLEPAALLGVSADAGPAKAIADASALPKSRQRDHLLKELGHRAPFDYELAEPRYQEQPEMLDSLCTVTQISKSPNNNAKNPLNDEIQPKSLNRSLHLARLYQALKEDAKHHSLRHLTILRKLLMAADRHYNLHGLSFYLTIEEIAALPDCDIEKAHAMAELRCQRRQKLLDLPPAAASLKLIDIERASSNAPAIVEHQEGILQGTRVAGSAAVQGKACVVSASDSEQGAPLENFADGDIIVCMMVHPAWLPQVLRAGGVICEIGGWLSHIAIVAREHDVPMIVAVEGLESIKQSCQLLLDLDGSIEVLDKARDNVAIGAAE